MILILGDIHAEYEIVNNQIEYVEATYGIKVDSVIQLGDFGIYKEPLEDYFDNNKQQFTRPLYFIDGNHEDFWNLESLTGKYRNYFKPLERGEKYSISGYNFLAIGGASYMDPVNTPPGAVITEDNIKKSLLHESKEIDIVITHDCPSGIGIPGTAGFEYCGPTGFKDGHILLKRYRPKVWFFAHHHKWFSAFIGRTLFVGLGLAKEGFALLNKDYDIKIIKRTVSIKKPGRIFNIFKELRR
ncbi:metallophosphoesterase [Candidatus Margulisiibacteriota bacterium]